MIKREEKIYRVINNTEKVICLSIVVTSLAFLVYVSVYSTSIILNSEVGDLVGQEIFMTSLPGVQGQVSIFCYKAIELCISALVASSATVSLLKVFKFANEIVLDPFCSRIRGNLCKNYMFKYYIENKELERDDINKKLREMMNKRGFDIKMADAEGNTPLLLACANGYEEIANELIEVGAAIDVVNSRQETALSLASSNNMGSTVGKLLDNTKVVINKMSRSVNKKDFYKVWIDLNRFRTFLDESKSRVKIETVTYLDESRKEVEPKVVEQRFKDCWKESNRELSQLSVNLIITSKRRSVKK